MPFLGLQIEKAAPGYRMKRFAAFVIDTVIVLLLLYIVYNFTGKPDFPGVGAAMDAAKAGATGPDAQKLANHMFELFNTAYMQTLLIWFIYEVLTQLIFRGASLGKLIMQLRIVPMKPNRHWALHHLLMIARSVLKMLFLFIFQGFPFIISELSIFANKEARAGFDVFVNTRVKDLKGEL